MTTVLDATTVSGARTLYRIAVALAAVSGAFCILFCAILVINYHGLLSPGGATTPAGEIAPPTSDPSYRVPATDSFNLLPTDYHSFLALRHALAQDRQNDEIRAKIRHLDYELRIDYFQRRTTIERTTILLIAASILFFVAMRTISVLKRQLPEPGSLKERKRAQGTQRSSWQFAVVVSWLMLFGGLYAGLLLAPPPKMEQIFLNRLVTDADADVPPGVPSPRVDAGMAAVVPVAAPAEPVRLTEEILAQNWVSFRNFDGNGIGFSDNPPIHWDGTTGENIIWQSEVPLPGTSSPVIWTNNTGGGKLFLSGADEETQKVFCYDIDTGELLWTADVTRPEAPMPNVYPCTGFAAPTPVVDGRHVYAMFANGELVAVDFSGNLVWRKSFGIPDNTYGFSSSPALYFDRLIVQFDDGDGTEGNSKLVALDLGTGDVIWETPRDLGNTWASPMIKRIGDSHQIITNANPYVIAYNPENGEEIWRVRCLAGDVGPSAVSFGNIVLITNDFPRTTAIDATGTGNITATHVLWTGAGATPDTVSPLATENYFLTLSTGGWLTGYDPTVLDTSRNPPRARFWELEVGDMASFYSSPLLVGTYVYIFSKTPVNEARGRQPEAFVIDLSKVAVDDNGMLTEESAAAMMIAINPMPEPVVTSPAILNNRIFVRGETMLFCIGDPTAVTPVAVTPTVVTPATATPAVPARLTDARLTDEILAQHWVSFRNFDGNGIGFSDNPPIHWDGTTGENIIWQSEVPLPGNSSPVIWGNKLFLSGADEESQMIFCFNRENGELLWTADVTRPEAPMPGVYPGTGFAAPTPVVDGQRVYAMFANGELVAVDFDGNLVWRKSFGIPDNVYGFSSSPALFFDRLIVQFDDGEGFVRHDDGEIGKLSRLVALDLNTGAVIWETPRDLPNTWASPTIKRIGDSYQIITSAIPYVIAYSPENGEEIWRVRCLVGDIGSSAIAHGDVVLAVSGFRGTAIDATSTGTVTTTHVLWTGSNSTSDTVSPVATENYFLMLCSDGWLAGYDPTVLDARQRARFWELEIGDMASFYSSPLLVGTYVYMFSKTPVNEARGTQPKAFVVDLSKVAVGEDGMLTDESAAAMIIAVNPMPEPVVTSPAILNNRIYIRGETMVYSIGEN